jgi:putative copper export protein
MRSQSPLLWMLLLVSKSLVALLFCSWFQLLLLKHPNFLNKLVLALIHQYKVGIGHRRGSLAGNAV